MKYIKDTGIGTFWGQKNAAGALVFSDCGWNPKKSPSRSWYANRKYREQVADLAAPECCKIPNMVFSAFLVPIGKLSTNVSERVIFYDAENANIRFKMAIDDVVRLLSNLLDHTNPCTFSERGFFGIYKIVSGGAHNYIEVYTDDP